MKKLYSSKKIGFKYQGNLSKKLRQYKNKQGKFKQNRYSSRKIQIRHKYPTRVRNKYTKKGGTNSPKTNTQDLTGKILFVINNETDSQNFKNNYQNKNKNNVSIIKVANDKIIDCENIKENCKKNYIKKYI